MAVVVLPTPPFWLATAMTRAMSFRSLGRGERESDSEISFRGENAQPRILRISRVNCGKRVRERSTWNSRLAADYWFCEGCSTWNSLGRQMFTLLVLG